MQYMKIYEHDHFNKQYEDYKNNMYLLMLNDDIEKWIKDNLSGSYDINCDDYVSDHCDFIVIEFTNIDDAMAFKLRWT